MRINSLARERANRLRRKWLEKVTQLEVTIAYFKRQLRYYERWKQRSAPRLSKGVSLVLDECGIDLDLKHATMDSIASVVLSLEAHRQAIEHDPVAPPQPVQREHSFRAPPRGRRRVVELTFKASASSGTMANTLLELRQNDRILAVSPPGTSPGSGFTAWP
eukprot:CAMPEP_0167779752 /NCGR_PEP_ID=MMETSP0111_2-20121227/4977_1 /TAXON_ID=91324 /ORGANISM="Lotharella globosa, Strain CCCM811" /LENGTH=161 /DNA_ID=CAMNT_0007670189 /DNA_START=237 /DNA_END=718 /DNA_ORIENTATION=-